jgi:hypothetical protein
MPASPITPALIRKVAEGLAGTTASVVIEAGRVRLIVVADSAQTVLPSPDEGADAWDKAVGIER